MFTEHLKKIIDGLDGAIGAVIMGLDGIAVETYLREGARSDINTIGMEFSFILTQANKAAEILKVGALEEVSVKAEQLQLVIRMLTGEYFLAVALAPDANFGKCRFLMRVAQPRLMAEL